MAGQTGHGQTFVFGTTTIPHITDINITNRGQTITQPVADLQYELAVAVRKSPKFDVNFVLPVTAKASLLAAIDQAVTGLIDAGNVAGLDYDAASAISEGYTISSGVASLVVATVTFTVSGSMTVTDTA